MKRNLVFLFFIVVILSCEKQYSFFFPVSDYALSFIPSNSDSIVFTNSTGLDTIYLTYDRFFENNQQQQDGTTLGEVSQRGYSSDSLFLVSYLLRSGIPKADSVGNTSKIDLLRIQANSSLHELYIDNSTIGGTLFYLDSLMLPDSTVYYDVFTDSNFYFMTRTYAIIQFKSDTTWYSRK